MVLLRYSECVNRSLERMDKQRQIYLRIVKAQTLSWFYLIVFYDHNYCVLGPGTSAELSQQEIFLLPSQKRLFRVRFFFYKILVCFYCRGEVILTGRTVYKILGTS